MIVWVLSIFMMTHEADGQLRWHVFNEVYRSNKACQLAAGAQYVKLAQENPGAQVDMGQNPCWKKKVH